MSTSVQLMGVPSADTPGAAVYVHNDKRSYIFGRTFEGAQRACLSRKIHFQRTEHIFVSGSVQWTQMAGLVSFLLDISAASSRASETTNQATKKAGAPGKPSWPRGVDLHGGDNLSHVLAALRAIVYRQPMRLAVHEQRDDPRTVVAENIEPDWQDDAIKVWKIPCRRAHSSRDGKKRGRASPLVARNADEDAAEQTTKARMLLSDPEVAALFIETDMFREGEQFYAIPRKLSQIKPSDVALTRRDGQLRRFKGPYTTDDASHRNPEETAWVLLKRGEFSRDELKTALNMRNAALPRTTYSDLSMSYIVKTHDRRGKMNSALANSLGVQGPDFRELASGKSVRVKDGTIVTPEMVVGETIPGNGFILADIESRDFLHSFLERPEWANAELMSNIKHMYWVLGPDLAAEPRIQEFIDAHPNMRHIMCAPETCPNMITHSHSATMQMQLRTIDPARFPMPQFDNSVNFPQPKDKSPVEFGRAGAKFQLMPRYKPVEDSVIPFLDLGAIRNMDPEVAMLVKQAQEKERDADRLSRMEAEEQDIPNRDTEVIPLGTGSSSPNTYRNVSATLIRVPGVGSYLLDCGEGTLGQIRRLFGTEKSQEVLRELRCIFISHLHADHLVGTLSVAKGWYEQTLRDGSNAKLAISCIRRFRFMLEELAQVEDFGLHRLEFLNCENLSRDDELEVHPQEERLGLRSVTRIPVDHCWRSHAVGFELTSGLRIAYSGDCRPSADFARECRGAHLLVHECTFDNDLASHAKEKKHSTAAEARAVARDMKARMTLLTHFSQRYVKSDRLKYVHETGPVVLTAFDMMRVKLGEFRQAAFYLPAIDKMIEGMAE